MPPRYLQPIAQRIRDYLSADDYNGLTAYLDGLTNSAFRSSCDMLAGDLLDKLDADAFWLVASHLILWKPKAFVATMAKAAARRVERGTLTFDNPAARQLFAQLQDPSHTIDRDKLLMRWLPICTEPATMEFLFSQLDTVTIQHRIDFLLRTPTMPASFVLLRTLRLEEHNRPLLIITARQLMRRGDGLAFNTASLLRTYFDLDELQGTFSLNIPPYALSRLDTDYDAFCRAVQG